MKSVRLSADQRKAQIVKVGAAQANARGLITVSQRTIGPKCEGIKYYGVKYHYPTKKELYQAIVNSGLLDKQTLSAAIHIGLVKDLGGKKYLVT